jgi:peroxiredoxin
MNTNLKDLPANLPIPKDDGSCNHLVGVDLPMLKLLSTNGQLVDFQDIKNRLVIYCYPMTGRPDTQLPDGWDEIPGARGCTPQACSFRDHYKELALLNTMVYGLSTQPSDYQKEAKERLHLPFELLSDVDFLFAKALNLPLFDVGDKKLNKRVTLIFDNGKLVKYFYPIFPPDKNIDDVLDWLRQDN